MGNAQTCCSQNDASEQHDVQDAALPRARFRDEQPVPENKDVSLEPQYVSPEPYESETVLSETSRVTPTHDAGVNKGELDGAKAHGFGKNVHPDGSVYGGEWMQDEKGDMVPRGRVRGDFSRGCKDGAGTYTNRKSGLLEYADSQCAYNKLDGPGTHRFTDGRIYRGQFAGGHMDGQGRMEWPNGATYEGNYENDRKSGEGTYTWPSGRKYIGQWCEGKRHGQGIIVDERGKETHGMWDMGTETTKKKGWLKRLGSRVSMGSRVPS